MEMTGAQILVEALTEQGVDTLFGYPGSTVINIFDALYANSGKIRVIQPAHEQGGAHAADGYARAMNLQPAETPSNGCRIAGVVLATSGPGATNLVTGIANAYMDSVPMVVITGNVPRRLMGRDSFQEVDICGVTMPVTKHNFLVQNIESLASTIKEAFTIAVSGRPGPVLVDIPKDITAERGAYIPAGAHQKRKTPAPAASKIRAAAELIAKSERPLLFCGGGVIGAGASGALRSFAEKRHIPVAATLMGITALPCGHPLMLGLIGMHGTKASHYAGEHCDLLISAGTRFSDRVTGDRTRFAPRARLIHLDIDPSEFNKNVVCDLHLMGDAKELLSLLDEAATVKAAAGWPEEMTRLKDIPLPEDPQKLRPAPLMRTIAHAAGPGAVIVTDVGQHQMWTAQYYPFCRPGSLITSGGLGAMGFGMGAAVGVKAASPDSPVVLITGDGSLHMNMAELSTAVTENLPIVTVLVNNGVLGMVRQWQRMFYDGRYAATAPGRGTNYVKLIEAFGGLGFRAETTKEAEDAVRAALQSGKTCLIDCRIGPDEAVLPMIPPGKTGKDIIYGNL